MPVVQRALVPIPSIDALDASAARNALVAPAEALGVEWTGAALEHALAYSGRYPYFLQEYGKYAWLEADGTEISTEDVDRAHPRVLDILDANFFHTRIERCTEVERRYLAAMAELGDGCEER